MRHLGKDGFTIQELFVVGLLMLGIAIPGLFLTYPKNYGAQQRNAERMVAVAEVVQGIHAYVAHNGQLPGGISRSIQPIGSASGQTNLCKSLVPTYLKTLPMDPFFGNSVNCSKDPVYETGLSIEKTGKGTQVTVAALGSEDKKIIYLTD